jgi:putative thioredoxin
VSTEAGTGATVFDVGEENFEQRVLARSRELPVVVDFWADWCGPCKQLTPVLERAATERSGKVELAKVDVDSNRRLQAAFQIQSIPAVKAFRDGRIAAEFTGALPPAEVERFFDALVPSEADELVASGEEGDLRRALELDPAHPTARRELGKLLLRRGETDQAVELLDGATGDFVADGLLARMSLGGDPRLDAAFEAWDGGDRSTALERLQEALQGEPDRERKDLIRRVMVALFTELGPDDPLAREHRRRLSAALN